MPLTFAANYKEIFATETVAKIDELIEDNYALEDILQFIDENSEKDFLDYYEEYVNQGEKLGYDVVDAFVGYHGLSCVEYCEDAFRGCYDSGAEFAEEFYDDAQVPSFLVVDWEATWEQSLSDDFDFVDVYVFSSNF